ncbi:MAG: hypothetical protein J6K92_07060 [Oscillospiraceae bacterium]|nr:hypothetical protein [Oscillospiraceae bacterium]
MSNTKAYKDYAIPREDYNELFWFCRRYRKNKEQIESFYGTHTPCSDGGSRSGAISKPTEATAIKIAKLRNECELIEQAAQEAGGEALASYIITNVTVPKKPYEYLGVVPCGRQQFYEMRRKFFYILWKNKFFQKMDN